MTPRKHPPAQQAADLEAALGPVLEEHARPEVVLLRVRRHGRRLTLPVLILIGVAGATGYWAGTLPETWMNVLAGIGAAAAILLLVLFPLLAWLAQTSTVTTRRVIIRQGLFIRHRAEVPLSRVREVRSRRGPLQRLFGSGDVELLVGADSTRLRDVPAPAVVVDALQELLERNYAQSMASQRFTGGFGTGGAQYPDPQYPGGAQNPGGAQYSFGQRAPAGYPSVPPPPGRPSFFDPDATAALPPDRR